MKAEQKTERKRTTCRRQLSSRRVRAFPGALAGGRGSGLDCQGDPDVLSRALERSSETIPMLTAFPEFSLPKRGLELINHLCSDPLMEFIFPKTSLLD